MISGATTVSEYLDSLPEERAKALRKVRTVIRKSIPSGYQECMSHGMIAYQVPLKALPETYNKEPLVYVALAAQKNNFSLYLMGPYGNESLRRKLEQGFRDSGKKLDMGKSCLRFRSVDDLDLLTIAKVIEACSMKAFIDFYHKSRSKSSSSRK